MLVRLCGFERYLNGYSEKYSLDWTHGRWQKRHPMVLIIHRMHTTCYTFLKIYFKYTPLPGSYFGMLLLPTRVVKYFMKIPYIIVFQTPCWKLLYVYLFINISICLLGFRKLTIALIKYQNCKRFSHPIMCNSETDSHIPFFLVILDKVVTWHFITLRPSIYILPCHSKVLYEQKVLHQSKSAMAMYKYIYIYIHIYITISIII